MPGTLFLRKYGRITRTRVSFLVLLLFFLATGNNQHSTNERTMKSFPPPLFPRLLSFHSGIDESNMMRTRMEHTNKKKARFWKSDDYLGETNYIRPKQRVRGVFIHAKDVTNTFINPPLYCSSKKAERRVFTFHRFCPNLHIHLITLPYSSFFFHCKSVSSALLTTLNFFYINSSPSNHLCTSITHSKEK